jgi:hypothetical protein
MAAVEKEIANIKTAISTLETSVKNLKLDFANMITGIIVQATNNPVLGYLNIPANVKLNMLMTYFGVSDQFSPSPPLATSGWMLLRTSLQAKSE